MLKPLAAVLMALAISGTAHAQNASLPALEGASVSLDRPSSALSPRFAATPLFHGEEHEQHTGWNRIKRGFYAGLIVGGLYGVFLVQKCGHPECGPLLTMSAGVGAAIGLGIDALVDRRPEAPGVAPADESRRIAFARQGRVSVGLRARW